jgi:hypothetical protein
MKYTRILFFGMLLAQPVVAQTPKPEQLTPEELITQAVLKPGSYSQMCDIQLVKRQVPLPLYGLTLHTEFVLSPEVLNRLRARRDEVIPSLVKRLEGIDFTKAPTTQELKFVEKTEIEEIDNSGLDPAHFSQILLKLVIDLNATECLPQLVRMEKELALRLEANAADPTKPVPDLQLDAGFIVGDPKTWFIEQQDRGDRELTEKEKAEQEAISKRVQTIIAQRDCLATMLCLLRNEKYAPLLASSFEKNFATALKENAAKDNLSEIKKPSDITEADATYIGFDPIHKLPTYMGSKVTEMKYTPEVRQQILEMVRSFEAKVPLEKRLGAKGMSAKTYAR